jgi:hypothetical protein
MDPRGESTGSEWALVFSKIDDDVLAILITKKMSNAGIERAKHLR